MRTLKSIQLLALLALCIGFTACSSDDDNGSNNLLDIETETVTK